jgi:hypothetical protein
MDDTPRAGSFSLINIPLTLRVNFLKFFFVNGGAFLGLHASLESPIEPQNGLGAMLGLGMKYDFDFGGSIFINPYGKIHTLVHFSLNDYPQRVLESGFRIGIAYSLGGR